MELQVTTFYLQVKACRQIDLRDNRGKRHEAALVLVLFSLALFCNRDGNMSRIHEFMEMRYTEVVSFLEIKNAPPKGISRAQLPLVLSRINYELLAFFVLGNSTFTVKISRQYWHALDGKEMRGTIIKGSKRGESLVFAVRHEDRAVVGQGYFNGKKESEIPAVRELLQQTGLKKGKVTMDALHLNPKTLELINKSEGSFLVGLKENQPELAKQMNDFSFYNSSHYHRIDDEKNHGREEERFYQCFDISNETFDKRWDDVNFQTLVVVIRKQNIVKKGKSAYEESYYLSNISTKNIQTADDLCTAVRNHWQVEVNNNSRDTVLQEDKFRTYETIRARTVSCCRSLVIRILDKLKIKNRRKKIDFFSIEFQECLRWLRATSFL